MAEASLDSSRPRRTQAERSADTRGRLLDATIESLVEEGAAGATTARIEQRAGVSRGARLHHFPTKAALVASAVQYLSERIAEDYARAMEQMGDGADRFSQGYRLLWEVYSSPAYAAVIELFVAARTDPELREALREGSAGQHKETRQRANAYFPDLATREADGLLELLQAAMVGLAVRRMVHDGAGAEVQVLDLLERVVDETFLTR